jgi:hypothetical protein
MACSNGSEHGRPTPGTFPDLASPPRWLRHFMTEAAKVPQTSHAPCSPPGQGGWLTPCPARAHRRCPQRPRRHCAMNHRAPRRAFALRRANGPRGRRAARRRAIRPRLRLAAAAGCALVSTTATLVSANELGQTFDGVLDVTPRGRATLDYAPPAWRTHDESHPVGWSARSQTADPRTPAREAHAFTEPHPPESPVPTEGDSPSPAVSDPSAEPPRAHNTEPTNDTAETAVTPPPSDGTPSGGETAGGDGTAGRQQPAEDGPDGPPGHDNHQRPDDSEADAGGDPESGEPQDEPRQNGDPQNNGTDQSDPGPENSGRSDADHGDRDGSDNGQGGAQRSSGHGPEARQNTTGDASQTAPASGPTTPTSWMDVAFTHALSWGP